MPINCRWPRAAESVELAADEAHAWAVQLDVPQSRYDEHFAILSAGERDRAALFHFDDPRRRFVSARGTLRRLLSRYLDEPPSAIELTVDQNQKPRLADKYATTGFRFNVSHSGDLALIAFTVGCEVGIDVEQLRDVGHLEQISRRFFHPLETEALMAALPAERSLAFLRCWTGKESILKALGTGIVGSLADFQVPVANDWQGWIECAAAPPHDRRAQCWLKQLTPCDDYVAAIACLGSERPVRYWTFEM